MIDRWNAPRRSGGSEHPPAATLAEAVENAFVYEFVHPHLVVCARCEAVFAELARAELQSERGELKAPPEYVAAALAVGDRRLRWRNAVQGVFESPHGQAWIGALHVAAAAIVIMFVFLGPSSRFDIDEFDTVREVVEAASLEGFVLPGVEDVSLLEDRRVFRSGVGQGQELNASIAKLVDLYEDGVARPRVAQWLISAYVATGQLRNARAFVDESRWADPEDPTLTMLDAILRMYESEPKTSESLLRSIADDSELARLNLAVLIGSLDDGARTDEAIALCAELETSSSSAAIRDRARRLRASWSAQG